MDVGIVNALEMITYHEVEPDLLEVCENLVHNKTPDATEQMLERTTLEKTRPENLKKGIVTDGAAAVVQAASWRDKTCQERLTHALINGITSATF